MARGNVFRTMGTPHGWYCSQVEPCEAPLAVCKAHFIALVLRGIHAPRASQRGFSPALVPSFSVRGGRGLVAFLLGDTFSQLLPLVF